MIAHVRHIDVRNRVAVAALALHTREINIEVGVRVCGGAVAVLAAAGSVLGVGTTLAERGLCVVTHAALARGAVTVEAVQGVCRTLKAAAHTVRAAIGAV